MGKDAPKQMAALVEKHKQAMDYAFVKEFTYRSLDKTSLEHTFRLIQELRKRSRQRENQAAEEADLVVQAKLVKMKDQRIPRLADLTTPTSRSEQLRPRGRSSSDLTSKTLWNNLALARFSRQIFSC